MGTSYRYECSRCSYSAQVCGGFDRGFEVFVVTATCPQCRELDDLALEPEVWRQCVGPDAKIPDDLKLKCSVDRSHQPVRWEGDCPRCQAKLDRDPNFVFDWD